ncbi:hypothetical protein [Aureimonas sp. D3]|uniref:hypothetical protein n=1 Tax=Aureimonas sp. D3 TaxID=1638164 RepID=UPI001FCDA57D|nr:hypothetical protein [Aureimonas sp. D3]
MPAYETKAADAVSRVAAEGLNGEVVDTALAMFVMRELEPRRFRSDRAFATQLVRRVRGVGDMNVGAGWDHRTGKVRRVYRELPPKVAEVMGAWITQALGAAGLRLAALEERDLEEKQRETQALYRALEGLT